ncbi:MAG TPA: hypothetical protein VEV81_14185 [Pyrinomonadaceae bacterium]|nr:hypothetical protein [Pyrinomonadaceae bacterium]
MAEAERKRRAEDEFSQPIGKLWLWLGLLTAPLVFLLHLEVNYALATQLCQSTHKIAMPLVTLAAVLVSAAGGALAWRNWQETGRKLPGEASGIIEPGRLLSAVGVFISLLFILILVAQLIPQFIFDPCQR